MIINGFGGHSAGPVGSPELLASITATLNQTETISNQTWWPGQGSGSPTTEFYNNYYKLASLTSATSGLTSQIPQLLSYTQNLMVDIVVTAITPPTITFSMTSSVISGSIWPFRISVASGINNSAYNFMNCYYRDCNQAAASSTSTTVNKANYGAISMLSSRKYLPSIYCVGYGAQGGGSYMISTLATTGSPSSWSTSTAPNFVFVNENYGGIYLCLNKNMSGNVTSGDPKSFAASGASATIRFDIYRSY